MMYPITVRWFIILLGILVAGSSRQPVLGESTGFQPFTADAWGAVGLLGGPIEGLVGTNGRYSPRGDRLTIEIDLRDDTTGQIYTPDRVEMSLDSDELPIVTTRWRVGENVRLTQTIFATNLSGDPIDGSSAARAVVVNQILGEIDATTHSWSLLVRVPGALTTEQWAGTDRGTALVANQRGQPAGDTIVYPGVLRSDHPAVTLQLLSPMTDSTWRPDPNIDGNALRSHVVAAWQKVLHQTDITITGYPSLAHAWVASQAYLLMAHHGNLFFSGPRAHHAQWVRDAVYISRALDETGHADLVTPMLEKIAASILPSGRVPPIIDADGNAVQPIKSEWDSQGELIVALVHHATMTGDLTWLGRLYPTIQNAVHYQQTLLQQTRRPDLVGTPLYGIFPAGESAEDLIDPTWHHYWDDFWGLAGFQEAAVAARRTGHAEDAPWMEQEERTLRQSIIDGVRMVRSSDGLAYIPNGPEDTHSTAMSRSGTPALWPVLVMDPNDPIIQHSFEAYYQWTVAPYGGAYRHYGNNDWPYAGLSLAHALYRIGRLDYVWTMLQWAMQHQTAPNLYAWAEAVHPGSATFAGGDMPHSWMASELILLVRDMLLHEDGGQIAIGPFPASWIAPGQTVRARDLPTVWGNVSITMTRSIDGNRLHLDLRGNPPDGFRIAIPNPLVARGYRIADGPTHPITGGVFMVPPDTTHVDIDLASNT